MKDSFEKQYRFIKKHTITSITTFLLLLSPMQADAAISDDLVGYYPFETNYDNSITTGGLPDGTAVNSPTAGTAGGRVGNAMSVSGSDNDHMNLIASFGNGNTLGTSFTISAWYNLNNPISSANSTNRYFVYESSNNYNISYGVRDSGQGAAGINDGQVYTNSGNFVIADAANAGWHHIIQTYTLDGADIVIQTLIDGKHVGTLTTASASFTGAGLNFGAARSTQANRGFDGLIDEVAIWDRALDAAELATVYALGLNSKPLFTTDPPSTSPTINSFTATPNSVTLGSTVNLAWNVTGSTSVTILEDLGNVAASGNQDITTTKVTTYTLVAINGNAVETAQVTINIDGPTDPVGPYVGRVKQSEAYFLYRPGPEEINLRLTVMTPAGATVASQESMSLLANDYVAKFHITGLTAETEYRYKIERVESGRTITLFAGNDPDHNFKTTPISRIGKIVTAGFVSCVNDTTDQVWSEMANHNLDLLVLAGDSPYVDSKALPTIRRKHREFLQRPNLQNLIKNTSVIGTWDDHDFGLNGGNGVSTSDRKALTRQGFVEYRAHDQYGNGSGEGIYHKADLGAIELFMLDPRWFSQTAASPINAGQSTCFGTEQWTWLLDALRNSEAPFKVLVQGQIWQDKKNGETDDMFTYWAERDALLNMIRDEKIPGVVLFGGDIHVARQLMHPRRVGYDLYDFIMSPGHKSVISSLNVYHPSLEWSREAQNQFLTMTADTTKSVPELTVKYLDQDGNLNREIVLTYDQLSYNEGSDLAKDLRALWTFDDDLKNQSTLGSRIDGTAMNGANRVATGGVIGGALSLDRSSQQYLKIPRSFLDDNSSTYSVSSWCKASSLPAHGSSERHFIMESYVNNHTGLSKASTTGYAISIGINPTSDSQKVNLQLFTETLAPTGVGSQQSPGVAPQGGFNWDVDRSLFSSWTNVAITFDATKLRLYINGTLAIEHTLTTAAPIAETGGLIIGGHRAGTGRNFDGLIDEVAIWNRVLTPAEITSIYNSGAPATIPSNTQQIDTDADGVPDYWENLYGLDKSDINDASSDTDKDGLSAMEEYGFGTLPNSKDQVLPYQQTKINVAGTDYLAISYQRNPAALQTLNIHIQRSTDLKASPPWNNLNTEVHSVTPLDNGLEQVVERSTTPIGTENKEFLRVRFSKK